MTVTIFSLSVTITGAFIGAGFVSGQEMWQFFGSFGYMGLVGLVSAMLVITALSVLTIKYAVITGNNTFEKVVSPTESKTLTAFTAVFEYGFYFAVYIIMTSGAKSLISDLFGIGNWISAFIFCLLVSVLALYGIKGIFSFFSWVIPVLTAVSVAIAVYTVVNQHDLIGTLLSQTASSNSDLLNNWLISALVFVSYNFMAGIGIFAALGKAKITDKALTVSSFFSFLLLIFLGGSIAISVMITKTHLYDMPMAVIAGQIHPIAQKIYSLILLLSMLGAGVSSLFPIYESIKAHMKKSNGGPVAITVSLSLLSVILSQFGFSELIGTVYPIFGYIGFAVIVIMLINFLKCKKGRKRS